MCASLVDSEDRALRHFHPGSTACRVFAFCCFFFNDTATTEIYTLSLHDALRSLRSPRPAGCAPCPRRTPGRDGRGDRKSTRLNSSHMSISYAVFCLKKKNDPAQSTAEST